MAESGECSALSIRSRHFFCVSAVKYGLGLAHVTGRGIALCSRDWRGLNLAHVTGGGLNLAHVAAAENTAHVIGVGIQFCSRDCYRKHRL